ncbi:MAG: hypothetical protein IAX21_06675 [Candidatus Bathyarchaeota archaeon]|nr:hypothetical protein [Candidatus Bathyarchaeum tardum]WGM89371.1 MAG: hypothetical protein NUK63_10780 [Candidatus Bathyarchaeum tardum]WNZ28354.1 MAG: hypothetical protein IAX21_06675 [Candidatus Bathyarchaeota archaeon]
MTAKKINFKGRLEADNLIFQKDTCFPETYKIFFPLDSTPDSKWEKCFDRVARINEAYLGRSISISGDNLVIIAPLDELDRQMFEKLQEIMDDTNRCVEEQG